MPQCIETKSYSHLALREGFAQFSVKVFLTCLLLGHSAWAASALDHTDSKGGAAPPGAIVRPGSNGGPQRNEGCPVNPNRLAAFANGESYDLPNLVTYLTSSGCDGESREIAKAAIGAGVNFSAKAPFRMDYYAKAIPSGDWDSVKRMDVALANAMPSLLRMNPLTSSQLLPILGQSSLISRSAGRVTLAQLIEQELITGAQASGLDDGKLKGPAIAEMAANLLKMGAGESAVASDLADTIEDQAFTAQAASLRDVLSGLADAATVESALVPTFNVSAGALSRGVMAGQPQYSEDQRREMMKTVYAAIRSALKGSGALEPGAAELNEAMVALMGDSKLTATVLRRVWKEVVGLLSTSATQTALASALSISLTPEIIFLKEGERQQILGAARNYPVIANSLQHNFLLAWGRVWGDLKANKIPTDTYNRIRKNYFEPLVAEMLDLDPTVLDSSWLKEVVKRGLVSDDDIEKKFPRFVLAYLDRREKAAWAPLNQSGPQPVLNAMAENFAVVWTLSNVHMPAIADWVRRNE